MLERIKEALRANNENLKTTLHQFSGSGDLAAVKSIVENNNELDINISSKGKNTALHSAIIHNQQGLIIDYLISKGADVNAFNTKGYNCVILAIIHCQPGIQALEKLMRAGAAWEKKFGRGKFSGLTVIDLAEQSKNFDALDLFRRMKPGEAKDETNKAKRSKNHQLCPLCNTFVKFPTKINFIESAQERAEENAIERVRLDLVCTSSIDRKKERKEIYTSRKYLDHFLYHRQGETYKQICGIEYHGIGNKGKLRKEISESYSILHAVNECCAKLEDPNSSSPELHLENVFLIDLCSGKSLTTALASLLFPNDICGKNHFLAIDKLPVHLVPHCLHGENTAYLSRDIMGNAFFEELKQEIHRQTSQGKTAVLVGMHLCGNLSERAIELFHRIKAIKALVLCPCCLPKLRKKADATAFQTFVGKEQEASYDPWCNFLKAKIEEGAAATDTICSHNDAEVHSIKNTIITAIRN